jgi:hypothetical protein
MITVLTTVSACSGGESGTGMQPEQTTVGEITGFGSIYVNGIHFETDQLETLEIDDDTNVAETDLEVGMVVTVVGSVSADGTQGVARQILMSTAVEGLVFSTNLQDSINVMGQTINITNDTHFNSSVPAISDFDQIATTTAVEVHGYTDGLGEFFATMVNVVQNNGVAPEVRLLGRIQSFTGDAASGSFTIGGITVQYETENPTSFDDGLQAGDLANDLYVEVESTNYTGAGNVLATEIERADLNDSEGSGYELEGVVTDTSNLMALNEFNLNGQRVVFDPMTVVFEGGDIADIQLDAELEVEGVYSNGALQAHEISFHVESDMEILGSVTAISGNTLTIDGVTTVTVNEITSYEDEVDEMNHYFSFDDITLGMFIKAKYYVDESMVNIATQIERTNP